MSAQSGEHAGVRHAEKTTMRARHFKLRDILDRHAELIANFAIRIRAARTFSTEGGNDRNSERGHERGAY